LLPGALAVLVVAACGDSEGPSDQPEGTTVTATSSLAFSPSSVQVAVGQSVTWRFQSVAHNVTFDQAPGVPADIPGSNSNTSIARTFGTAGTFTYHCTIHPEMHGTIVVAAAAATTSTPASPPTTPDAPAPGY
jgi:plastocyanin